MPNRAIRMATAASALAAALLACAAPTGLGPTPTPSPSATATETPTPTPTPTPLPQADLDSGDAALMNGDWDAALANYHQALAAATDEAAKAGAQLGIAATLLRAGRFDEAAAAFTDMISAYPGDSRSADAYFERGLAFEELGKLPEAIADYRQYLSARPGVIDSFVHERIGRLFSQGKDYLSAIPEYQAAISAPRLGDTLGVRLSLGNAYMMAKELDQALAEFDGVYQAASDGATKATANYLAGEALLLKGDNPGAYARFMDSVKNYPEAADAYSGLVRLVDADQPVDPYLRGLVDYNAGAYAPALDAFNRAILSQPTADGLYYRGLTKLALGNASDAAEDFRRVIEGYPQDPRRADAFQTLARTEWAYLDQDTQAIQTYLDFVAAMPTNAAAPDGLFQAGRAAERANDLRRAAEIWSRLPKEYPGTSQAIQGAFAAGIALYRAGDPNGALSAFQEASPQGADSSQRAASLFWQGKSLKAAGNAAGAQQAWQDAANADPTGYYSLRAADELAGRVPFQSLGMFDFTTNAASEQAEAEAWLKTKVPIKGPEPLSVLDPGLAGDLRMQRGEEFLRLGLFEEATAEFDDLRKAVASDGEANYRLMHKFLDLHLYRQAIYCARQVLTDAGMDDAATAQAPVYFNHIRFAPYFGDIILPAAVDEKLDPLFLLSVIRQESLFEGFATSYAEARGLMQVIPTTGAELAQRLNWPPGYTDKDLYRPMVSVRFGAAYLAEQKDRFDGDLFAALAAYNAGPGNAMIWKELAPNDPDLFLEVIRLDQPHAYIVTIYEVFARYRDLYTKP